MLDIILCGVKLDFIQPPPFYYSHIRTHFSTYQELAINQVLTTTTLSPTSYVSPIVTTEKKDGSNRLILNLKHFNECFVYFKMENLQDVFDLIKPGVWMASIDLRDAYYTIPVARDHQQYLTFSWKGVYYCYTCLPNGYSQALYIFTKLLKVPFGYLRKQGHSSVVYIDDTYLQGDTPRLCHNNVWDTEKLLWDLGFHLHTNKSLRIPSQRLEFLGFILDSNAMTVTLTDKCKQNILDMCKVLLQQPCQTTKSIAALVGCFIAALPGVKYGALFYRRLEQYKKKCLLAEDALVDMKWWSINVEGASKFIHPSPVALTLYADASLEGWGGTNSFSDIGGRWSVSELPTHINTLELLAAKFVLQSFGKDSSGCHIKLMLDNMTAVSNKMDGTHSLDCQLVAREIWLWAKERNIWLSADHIAASDNIIADFKSRNFKEKTEWKLSPDVFNKVTTG